MQPINDEKNSFGERLREERQKLGVTQENLGTICGVTRLTQSKYEKGESAPNTEYLRMLQKCGFDINYLINGGALIDKNAVDIHGENADLAAAIIEELETMIQEKGMQLSPAKKAQLVATIYRNSRAKFPVNTRLVSDLLILAIS